MNKILAAGRLPFKRRLAPPAFHGERINRDAQTMVRYTHELLADWADNIVRDIHADMMRLTLRVVGKTLFDTDFKSAAPDIGESLAAALHGLSAQMIGLEFLLPAAIPTPSRYRLRRAVERLDSFVLRIISERRRS